MTYLKIMIMPNYAMETIGLRGDKWLKAQLKNFIRNK